MPDVYDKERSKEDLNHLTGISAGEERLIEEAAHRDHSANGINNLENQFNGPAANPTDTQSPEAIGAQEASGGQQSPWRFNGSGSGKIAKARKIVAIVKNPKKALAGAGIISFLIILALTFSGFSAFELINLRENLLGHGNRFTNSVLQNRRATSMGTMLRKLNQGTFEENINKVKFKEAFEKQGFKVEFDEKGKLTEFSYTSKAHGRRVFDLATDDTLKATNDFFGDKKFGLEVSRAYDKVASTQGRLWAGPKARDVYRKYGFKFYDWLNRKPSDKAKTTRQKFAENLRYADVEATDEATGTKTKQQLEEENGKNDGTKVDAYNGADALNGAYNNGLSPEQYAKAMRENPSATDKILGLGSSADIDTLASNTTTAFKNVDGISVDKIATGSFRGSIDGLIKGLNILGTAQGACEVKGILNFVSNARNIALSIELARFSVRILNAADDQKAGILQSEGLNMLMIYLHTPNPKNGKSAFASGGIQNRLGDGSFVPSSVDRSRYGVGRTNSGALASISSFVNNFPGANHCKVVNNGFVTAGGYAVGITAAVLSGGSETAANTTLTVGLAAAKEVTIQLAIPILIKTGAHILMNGLDENGEMAGDALASGFGSFSGMVAGANGMRASTNQQIALMTPEVDYKEQQEIAQKNVFDRYLNIENSQSLISHVAMSMPQSFGSFLTSSNIAFTGLMSNITNLNALSFFMPGNIKTAFAAPINTSACDDPQVKLHGTATDPFCNPIMANSPNLNQSVTEKILLANQQIDSEHQPTATKQGDGKSFSEYIEDCFSGRPALLYNADPDQEGNESPIDDTCVTPGDPLPGDTVGRYDRFTNYYGYLVDSGSIVDSLQ